MAAALEIEIRDRRRTAVRPRFGGEFFRDFLPVEPKFVFLRRRELDFAPRERRRRHAGAENRQRVLAQRRGFGGFDGRGEEAVPAAENARVGQALRRGNAQTQLRVGVERLVLKVFLIAENRRRHRNGRGDFEDFRRKRGELRLRFPFRRRHGRGNVRRGSRRSVPAGNRRFLCGERRRASRQNEGNSENAQIHFFRSDAGG